MLNVGDMPEGTEGQWGDRQKQNVTGKGQARVVDTERMAKTSLAQGAYKHE